MFNIVLIGTLTSCGFTVPRPEIKNGGMEIVQEEDNIEQKYDAKIISSKYDEPIETLSSHNFNFNKT